MTFQSNRTIHVNSDLPEEDQNSELDHDEVAEVEHEADSNIDREGDASLNLRETEELQETNNPYDVQLDRSRPRKFYKRIARSIRNLFYHPPTPEEMAKKSESARRRAEQSMLKKEADKLEEIFWEEFDNAGLVGAKKGFLRKKLRFAWRKSNLQAHYFKVNMKNRPKKVDVDNLADKSLMGNIEVHAGLPVGIRANKDDGVVFRVDRAGNTSGVPAHVTIQEMWDRFPASADGLSIAFGMANNSRPIFWSLADQHHLLIAGTTGGGKSNEIKNIVCTYIRRNSPHRLRFLLIDLKRTDFRVFAGIPHLMQLEGITDDKDIGIIKNKDNVLAAMDWAKSEMDRRFKLFDEDEEKPANIAEFNQHHRLSPLYRLVIIFDEYGAMTDHGDGAKVMDRIVSIAEMGRSAGVHLILSTQTPTTAVINGRIKNNIPAKLAFNCSNLHGSMAILGNGQAHDLAPEGRAILDFKKTMELQTPLMTREVIEATVAGTKEGSFEAIQAKHDVTPEEVMQFALRERKGYLTLQRGNSLYEHFSDRGISRDELQAWLTDWESKEFVVNDVLYRVEKASGRLPRRLVPVEQHEDQEKKA